MSTGDTYMVCEKCTRRFAVGNVPTNVCGDCDENQRLRTALAAAESRCATLESALTRASRNLIAFRTALTGANEEIERLRGALDAITNDEVPINEGDEFHSITQAKYASAAVIASRKGYQAYTPTDGSGASPITPPQDPGATS